MAIPAKGADQAPITQLIEQWKVGRALPGDTESTQIRASAAAVLNSVVYRDEARRRSLAFAGPDGAVLAADSVEGLLGGPSGASPGV